MGDGKKKTAYNQRRSSSKRKEYEEAVEDRKDRLIWGIWPGADQPSFSCRNGEPGATCTIRLNRKEENVGSPPFSLRAIFWRAYTAQPRNGWASRKTATWP